MAKRCPETGETCDAVNCNIARGNCYKQYDPNWEQEWEQATPKGGCFIKGGCMLIGFMLLLVWI